MSRSRGGGPTHGRRRGGAWLALSLGLLAAAPATAQSFRGWAGTTLQLVELRPLGVDTVARADVLTDVEGRFLYRGLEVSCEGVDTCTGYLPLAERTALAATQDVSLTFWGLGVRGLSATTLLRGRVRGGDAFVWPRSDDAFDALLAYAELQRGSWRVRAGRQEIRSGLGMSGFDGLRGAYYSRAVRGEVYAGRSLARALREPANSALRSLEDFFVDEGVLLFGASATAGRLGALVTARYQREIYADRSGLVSERGGLDLVGSARGVGVSAALDYDFSFQRVGKAHVTLSRPLQGGLWQVELAGRRYVPYFDLSTIWGFFEPVTYTEALARVGWSPDARLGVAVTGAWRAYGDAAATPLLQPLRDTGWRAHARATWSASAAWTASAGYELEWGSGGFLSAADVALRHAWSARLSASVSLTTFQAFEEYRLGDGRAWGVGASADHGLGDRLTVAAGASVLRHRDGRNVFTSPWNQTRAWTSVRVQVGRDPGSAGGGGAP